jgi:catechol 2,3-dioxygenase-like lactoylglutathione lyase family enzyme
MPAPQNNVTPILAGYAPVFLVDDVRAAVDYYVSALGFKLDFVWPDPPTYGGVSRDSVTLHFAQADRAGKFNSVRAAGASTKADLNVFVRGIHDLYRDLVGRGARVDGPPVRQPYGMTNFHVDDLNGYRLCFGQATSTCAVEA